MKKFIKFFLIITIAFNLTPNLYSAENYQNKILKYVNQERKNKKLAPLVMNEKLNKTAQYTMMFRCNFENYIQEFGI